MSMLANRLFSRGVHFVVCPKISLWPCQHYLMDSVVSRILEGLVDTFLTSALLAHVATIVSSLVYRYAVIHQLDDMLSTLTK